MHVINLISQLDLHYKSQVKIISKFLKLEIYVDNKLKY